MMLFFEVSVQDTVTDFIGLAIATAIVLFVRFGQSKLEKMLKTNHGTDSIGDSADKSLAMLQEIKADIRGIRKDLGRVENAQMESRSAQDRAHDRLADRVFRIEQQINPTMKEKQ